MNKPVKLFFMVLLILSVACSDRAVEFDKQCQAAWPEYVLISDAVHKKLRERKFEHFLSVKAGSDRGGYSFYFLAKSNLSAFVLFADTQKIITVDLPGSEAEKVFSLLPDVPGSIQSFTGKGETWAHLACAYLAIGEKESVTILSFHDYILLPDGANLASRQGVNLMWQVKQSITQIVENSHKEQIHRVVIREMDLGKDSRQIATVKIMPRVNIFYEIPRV